MTKKDISILYVEDEESIRNLYTPLIKKRTANFFLAKNGKEGLSLFKKHKPELVISDIRMPIMDGLEMTSKIKEIDQESRIIIITAFSQHEYFTRAIKLGVNGFLVKPVSKDDLMAVIDEQAKIILFKKNILQEERKRDSAEQAQKRSDAILKAVSFAGEQFLRKKYGEDTIPQVLKKLGEATSVSRVYLFENKYISKEIITTHRYEWVAKGIKPQIDNKELLGFSLIKNGFERWVTILSKRETLFGIIKDFPDNEQKILTPQNILSIVVVPIFLNNKWWGFIGIDDCKNERIWNDHELKALITAANLIGTAIHREKIEEKLINLNSELERRVKKRTKELQKEINERIQAEEMLRESEEKYRQIFENANDGILLTINGIVRFINPKLYEITGFLPKESISRPFTDFVHPDYQEIVYNNHLGRLKGEDVPERYDIQAYTKKGDLRWFEIKSAIIQWEDQPAVLTFLTDVTERKKIASELHELNLHLENRVQTELKKIKEQQQQLIQKSKLESLGELAAGIAHEINQPLGGISLLLDNIHYKSTKGKLTSEYLEEKLRKSFEDIDRIKMIIDHIRAFSRDQDTTDFIRIDIQEVIMNALGMIKHQYQKYDIEFELNLNCQEPFILGNPYKLEQVLLNLFSNARFAVSEKCKQFAEKNIPLRKKIIISTYNSNNEIGFSIEDNGIGIPKKLQKNIFDPFFTTKSEEVGTGLGLSISYGIIKEMHGNISVESKENEFTKMIVGFPIYKQEQ